MNAEYYKRIDRSLADVRSGAVSGPALDTLQMSCRKELGRLQDELAGLLAELRAETYAARRRPLSRASQAA